MNRKIFRIFLAAFAALVISGGLWLSCQYTVPILMYHHIAVNSDERVDTVTPENFAAQMAYLYQHHYHVLTIDEYISALIEKRPLPRKTVVLTFDDAYDDNYFNAFPILKQYDFAWTLFIPSDFIDTPGYLSLDQIKEMMHHGMTVGSHSRRHVYLLDITDLESLDDEIAQSKRILEEALAASVNFFSYPIGGFNDAIIGDLQKAGYTGAVTTNRGNFRNKNRWALTRIKVKDKDAGLRFRAKLSGFYNIVRTPKQPTASMCEHSVDGRPALPVKD